MTRNKFGPNGLSVEAFFAEVAATKEVETWRVVLANYRARSKIAAMKALDGLDVGLSASVESAVAKASYSAFVKAGIRDSDFPGELWPFDTFNGMVGLAAMALALGSRMPNEHRLTVLGPFAAAGFESVAVGLSDQDADGGTEGAE